MMACQSRYIMRVDYMTKFQIRHPFFIHPAILVFQQLGYIQADRSLFCS